MFKSAVTSLAIGVLVFSGATVNAAGDAYPPDATIETTTPTTPESGPLHPSGAPLPATGSDATGTALRIAGGLVVAGAGLATVAAVRRRRDAPSTLPPSSVRSQ